MKTRLMSIAVIMFLGIGMAANAQKENKQNFKRPRFNAEKMDSMQCKRMVDELMLNDATTAKFKTVYMNYLSEMRDLRKPQDFANKGEEKKEWKDKTDADVQKDLENYFDKEQKQLDIKVKYYKEFKRILSPKQIVRIFRQKRNKKDIQPRFFANGMMPRFAQRHQGQGNNEQKNQNDFPQQQAENND